VGIGTGNASAMVGINIMFFSVLIASHAMQRIYLTTISSL